MEPVLPVAVPGTVAFPGRLRGIVGRRVTAFSLIELLVVIAIIAVLASLLLPALASAKARAQRLTCTSQMKQLGLGMELFKTDHEGRYPPTAYSTGDFQYHLSWDAY